MLKQWFPDDRERRWLVRWSLVALAFGLIAAIFSSGWYAYDEHWQILEFANAFLGREPRGGLPWEYAARARPTLQPLFYAGIERILIALGVANPFTMATVFRLVTAVLAWAATMFAGLACSRRFRDSPMRRWTIPALALAWYLPYLHARTSSENACEMMFLAGFGLLVLRTEAAGAHPLGTLDALVIGVLFGLSFELRYQAGFMVAGALAWCVLVARVGFRATALLALGVVLSVALGTLADRWFYGQWTFAPWNYFHVNITEHKASSFGTAPWWMYFRTMVDRLGPPLSILVAAGVLHVWVRRPLSLGAWSTLPFVIAHCLVAHKEFRFMFPIATLTVLLTVRMVNDVCLTRPGLIDALRRHRWSRGLFWLAFAENAGLLCAACLRTSQPVLPLLETIWTMKPAPLVIYYRGDQPFRVGKDLFLHFYQPPKLLMIEMSSLQALDSDLRARDVLFISPGFKLPADDGGLARDCTAIYRTIPVWMRRFDINGWIERTANWTLYRCHVPNAVIPQYETVRAD